MTHLFTSARRLALAFSAAALLSACAVTQGANTSSPDGSQPVRLAFLSASSANTWLTASLDAMQQDAAKNNAEIVTFDAKFEPGVAAKQMQDVIASGRYDGVFIATIDGVGAAPAVESAIQAGLKVVVLNQIIGTDLTTADPQVEGVSASVLAPPQATGTRLGKLTVQACEGVNPCDVVFMYGAKGSPLDSAVRAGFDEQIATNPAITVVAEGEGGYLGTDEPRKVTQDIIQAHPHFNVLAGTGDQQIRGSVIALHDAGITDVKLIGVGGSAPAIEGVRDGTWYADVAGAPVTEGHVAFEAMMHALDGQDDGGIDVTTQLVDDGLITSQNVDKFTAQWQG
ncbi:MAG: sugar ABC transporter substrate-binding protein [Actinomycetales bacterium]